MCGGGRWRGPLEGTMQIKYNDGRVILICADMRDAVPALAGAGFYWHATITDPPYGKRTHEGARRGGLDTALINFAPFDVDEVRAAFALCAKHGARAADPAQRMRWLLATIDAAHVGALQDEPLEGLAFVRGGVWVKPGTAPQFTGDRPAQGHEATVEMHAASESPWRLAAVVPPDANDPDARGWDAIAHLHATGVKYRWNGKGRHAVYTHPPERREGRHPAAKPVALYTEWIELFTDPGDVILDPFAGDGALLVAAHLTGRRAIGIELDPKWCDATAARMARVVAGDWESEAAPTRRLVAERKVA